MRKLDDTSRCLPMKQISSMEISPRALGHPWSYAFKICSIPSKFMHSKLDYFKLLSHGSHNIKRGCSWPPPVGRLERPRTTADGCRTPGVKTAILKSTGIPKQRTFIDVPQNTVPITAIGSIRSTACKQWRVVVLSSVSSCLLCIMSPP
jgi:hypothetical protein